MLLRVAEMRILSARRAGAAVFFPLCSAFPPSLWALGEGAKDLIYIFGGRTKCAVSIQGLT